jgi:alpha-N-arabinofuranosidase
MYSAHQGGKSVRAVFNVPTLTTPKAASAHLPGLAGSASLHDRQLVLTVVNPSVDQSAEVNILVRDASVKTASGKVLNATDVHAHNTFDQPKAVTTRDINAVVKDGRLVHTFPPASVTCLQMDLS